MPRKAHLEYSVEPHRHGWTILFCGAPHGEFDKLQDAIENALIDADHAGRMGHDIDVLVRRDEAHAEERWSFDHILLRMSKVAEAGEA
jgi:hypothetical protein